MTNVPPPAADRRLAVLAESLYLVNLTLLPLLEFLALWWLHTRHIQGAGPLARGHLAQALRASIGAGALLVAAVALLLGTGDLRQPMTWVAITSYVICVHSALVLAGVIGLARAMAAKPWRYPLVGGG